MVATRSGRVSTTNADQTSDLLSTSSSRPTQQNYDANVLSTPVSKTASSANKSVSFSIPETKTVAASAEQEEGGEMEGIVVLREVVAQEETENGFGD